MAKKVLVLLWGITVTDILLTDWVLTSQLHNQHIQAAITASITTLPFIITDFYGGYLKRMQSYGNVTN
jgi:hypothetical protein